MLLLFFWWNINDKWYYRKDKNWKNHNFKELYNWKKSTTQSAKVWKESTTQSAKDESIVANYHRTTEQDISSHK
jgi:hypothetical protein